MHILRAMRSLTTLFTKQLAALCLFHLLGLSGTACVPSESDPTLTAPTAASAAALTAAEADEPSSQDPADWVSGPTDAPPPGCWAERSCGARKYVCKRPDNARPCGAPGCVEMQFACSSDAGCLEGYACALCKPGDPFPCSFATGLCKPKACASDRDCGSANLKCTSGRCEHKPCRSSLSCRGYCVAGACWNKTGWCHDTTLPPPP